MTERTDGSRFIVADYRPAYAAPGRLEELRQRARLAEQALRSCHLCPRSCGANRLADEVGTCQIGRLARVSSAFPHFGEEDCLRGRHGSGTIFFAGCNLRCVFCQNEDISQCATGATCRPEQLAGLMLALQAEGCHNINLVTPTHVVPQILQSLVVAIEGGLHVPLVYNTSAYDALEALRWLEGIVDIYMPDFKLWSANVCERYLHAPDYGERARAAIREMHRQVGDLHTTPDGIACRGLLVRHLVMPGLVEESAAIFEWLAQEVSPDTYVNVMGQYRPSNLVDSAHFGEINRRPTAAETSAAWRAARQAGLWRFD